VEESARAVLLSPRRGLLLMKVKGASRELWITPGGRRELSESPQQALARELREETGFLGSCRHAPEIWIRTGRFRRDGIELRERERFFLLVVENEFTPVPRRMGDDERKRFAGFRWWTWREIADSRERFVPADLAGLLSRLIAEGPPPEPILVEEQ